MRHGSSLAIATAGPVRQARISLVALETFNERPGRSLTSRTNPRGGGTPRELGTPANPRARAAQPDVSVNRRVTQKSSVACGSAQSRIPVPPRFFCVGCSALVRRSALVASTLTRCPSASSSACTPACWSSQRCQTRSFERCWRAWSPMR